MKQIIGRKLLSSLLTLAMVLGLIPGISITAYADNPPFEIKGNAVNPEIDSSGEGWSYDHTSKTLTLNGFSYNGSFYGIKNTAIEGLTIIVNGENNSINGAYIYSEKALTIDVNGTLSINDDIYCIASYEPLNIKGSGTLNLGCTGDAAIYSVKDLTISESVNITAEASDTGIFCENDDSKLTLESSGEINVKGSAFWGICSNGEIEITNGNVTAEGGTSGIGQNGGGAPLVIGTDAKLVAIGGDNGAIYYYTDSNHRKVQNAIAGVAWTNKAGTEGKQNIAINTEGQPIPNIYKKVKFLVSHTHSFTYTATGATITATCSEDGCTLTDSKATLTIAPPAKTVYGDSNSATATLTGLEAFNTATGKTVAASNIAYYAATKSGTIYTKSGNALASAPTNAGDYVAEITVGTGDNAPTGSVGYTIAKAQADSLSAEQAREGVTINYAEETATAQNTFEVSLDGVNKSDSPANLGDIFNSTETPTIYVRRAATDDKSFGEWVAVTLASRQDEPSGLTVENASSATATDGKIKGTTTDMEYSSNGGTSWTSASADLTLVGAGTYLVRMKATLTAPSGKTVQVTVGSKELVLSDDQKPTEKTGLVYTGSEQNLVEEPVSTLPEGASELLYAFGDNDETAPSTGWSSTLPVGKEAKIYYIWYKVKGDENHSDTEPQVIIVTINEEIVISYHANGGKGTMADQKVGKNTATTLKTNAFTRDGYSFKEWNTKENGSGTSFADKAEVTLEVSLDLYAQWNKVEVHTHHIEKVEAVEPGCETDGNKTYYRCVDEGCDKWFEDDTMISEITDKSSVLIKAISHKWDDGEITREATYDEDGEKTYTCQNDPSHTKKEVIPKKTRSNESENTADTSGSSTNVSRRIGEESNSGSSSSSSGSSSSDSGSSSSSGSSSKTYTAAQAKVDQVNNVTSSHKILENHQVETGVAVSDVGGNWNHKVNADTWTYTKSDGTLAKGEWLSLDYNGLRYWYYFDDDTNMRTNWFDYKGERFYLVPQKDGWRGRMATGWKNIEKKWYYFEIVPGASQGRLYRSTVTPDGHTVGADGAWNGVGTTPVGQE